MMVISPPLFETDSNCSEVILLDVSEADDAAELLPARPWMRMVPALPWLSGGVGGREPGSGTRSGGRGINGSLVVLMSSPSAVNALP